MMRLAFLHILCYFGVRDCVLGVGEGSFVFDFASSAKEGTESGAGEGTSHTDAFYSGGGELLDGVGCSLKAHEDVDGFGDLPAHFADGFEAGESGCVDDVGTGFGEGLQAQDGVVEIGPAVEEVFRSCGEKKLVSVGSLGGCGDAFYGELEVVDGMVGVDAGIFDGSAGEADSRCETNRLGACFR